MWCLNHLFSANSDLQKGFVHGWNDRQFCKSCSSSRFNSGMEWIFEVYILIIIFSWFKRYKIFLCIYIGMYFYLSDISKSERMFFILRLSKNPNFHFYLRSQEFQFDRWINNEANLATLEQGYELNRVKLKQQSWKDRSVRQDNNKMKLG